MNKKRMERWKEGIERERGEFENGESAKEGRGGGGGGGGESDLL